MKTTEDLRNDVLSIRQALREGKMSNSVARTLLAGSKLVLDSLKVEMEATRLGADFGAVALNEIDRRKAGEARPN